MKVIPCTLTVLSSHFREASMRLSVSVERYAEIREKTFDSSLKTAFPSYTRFPADRLSVAPAEKSMFLNLALPLLCQ
jgi:hypothetical protein